MTDVKFPEVEIKLVGQDGNAFAILGRCQQAMRRAKLPKETVDEFIAEATSGDYNNLLRTCMAWFNCDSADDDDGWDDDDWE